MIHLLLLASLAFGSTDTVRSDDLEITLSNLGKDVRDLQSGRPVITGLPQYRNGIKFGDGTTQMTAGVGFSSRTATGTDNIGTTYTTVAGTTATVTTFGTRPIECCLSISIQVSAADNEALVRLCQGGSNGTPGCYTPGGFHQGPADSNDRGTVSFCDGPAAPLSIGTYTFYIQAKANSGTIDIRGNLAKTRIRCMEIPAL